MDGFAKYVVSMLFFTMCQGNLLRHQRLIATAPLEDLGLQGQSLHRQRRSNNEVIRSPIIDAMSIQSDVSARFASVVIHSEMRNPYNEGLQAVFLVQIPETAFISKFTMFLNDTLFIGRVLEKSAAEKEYDDAVKQGQSAGQVVSSPPLPARGMDIFAIHTNVASMSEVVFELTYQELLTRELGVFEQRINVQPNQIVPNFTLSAQIYEFQGLNTFQYATPNSEQFLEASSVDVSLESSMTTRNIVYNPSVAGQTAMNSGKGLQGDFVIKYDVNHDDSGGVILIENGYFAHYFSPSSLPPLDKNVVFVIDISGSMAGEKMIQTRSAIDTILGRLRSNDKFNILLFDNTVVSWKSELMVASSANVNAAKSYCNDYLVADGSTNINDALVEGVNFLKRSGFDQRRADILMFLTDGLPSSGETIPTKIRKNVKQQNNGRVSIFSLGFGQNVDFGFLSDLSWENGGFAKKIYVGTDASVQLDDFFQQVESPLLLDVQMSFKGGVVSTNDVTKHDFSQYFKGSELVVAGKLIPGAQESALRIDVVSQGAQGEKQYTVAPSTGSLSAIGWNNGFLEKLWAYLKLRDLLHEESVEEDETLKAALRENALNMALQYNFVTRLTSLVVTLNSPHVNPNNNYQDMFAMNAGGKITSAASGVVGLPFGFLLMLGSFVCFLYMK